MSVREYDRAASAPDRSESDYDRIYTDKTRQLPGGQSQDQDQESGGGGGGGGG